MIFLRQLALVGTLVVVAAAALPIRAAPSVTQGTATPLQVVLALVQPFTTPGAAQGACNTLTGQIAACPITARLRYRLQHTKENGNLICRCQTPPEKVRAALTGSTPFVALVDTRWAYGAGGSLGYTITFVVGRQDDGWRVDDAYCAGRPRTSVYDPPAGPCR